jgi:hypothetical protein
MNMLRPGHRMRPATLLRWRAASPLIPAQAEIQSLCSVVRGSPLSRGRAERAAWHMLHMYLAGGGRAWIR